MGAKNSDFQVYTADVCEDMGIEVQEKYVYNSKLEVFASYGDEETVRQKVKRRKQWDPTLARSGDEKCFNDKKPKSFYDPITDEPLLKSCTMEGDNVHSVVQQDDQYCAALRDNATAFCGTIPFAVGGSRKDDSDTCVFACALDWSTGADNLFAGDTVYYVCSQDDLDNLES